MGGMIAPKIPLVALVIDVHLVRNQDVLDVSSIKGNVALLSPGRVGCA